MARIVLDEDVQKSLAVLLRQQGHQVFRVQEVGLRGASDVRVFDFAQMERAVLITADLGLADMRTYAGGTHSGIILLRMPHQLPVEAMNAEILRLLHDVNLEQITNTLLVLAPGSMRIRRPT